MHGQQNIKIRLTGFRVEI